MGAAICRTGRVAMNEHGVFIPFGSERLAGVLTLPGDDFEMIWVLLPGQ